MNTVLGAILGDYVGSSYEGTGIKGLTLPLTLPTSQITDDSIMTFATLEALLTRQHFGTSLAEMCNRYPDNGFGSTMKQWLAGEDINYLNSDSNGGAIRISPIACLDTGLSQILRLVEHNTCLTHTGEGAIKGACALAESIHLARSNVDKYMIKQQIERKYQYTLEYNADDLYKHLSFTAEAAVTVPIAIWLGLVSRTPEQCLRLGLYIGGDTDSILSMALSLSLSFDSAAIPVQPYKELLRHLSFNYPEFKKMLSISKVVH